MCTFHCMWSSNALPVFGWLQILPTLRFIEGGAQYLTIEPVNAGASGEWYNLATITAPVSAVIPCVIYT